MDKTSVVTVRIDADLKESAEKILSRIGITPSAAIQLFYHQIVLTNGIPFDLRLPSEKPTAVGGMSRSQLSAELMKGVESLASGRSRTVDEVDARLFQEFGI